MNAPRDPGIGIRYSSLYGASLVATKLLRGLVVPKLLDPGAYGLFTSIALYTRYLSFSDLGAIAQFVKALPRVHFGAADPDARELVDNTIRRVAIGVALAAILLLLTAAAYRGRNLGFYRTAILLLIPTLAVSKLREIHVCYLQGTGRFREFAYLAMVGNALSLVVVSIGVFWYKAVGGVVATLVAEALMLAVTLGVIRLKIVRPVFRWPTASARPNFKQLQVQVTETVAVTVDQALLLTLFGPLGFGKYVLGLTFAWVFEALSEVFNTAFYPRIMASGLKGTDAVGATVQQALRLFLGTALLAVPGVLLALDWMLIHYFTRYRESAGLYFGMLFLGVTRGGLALLKKGYLATDRENRYIGLSALAACVTLVCGLAARWIGLPFGDLVLVLIAANAVNYLLFYANLVSFRQQHAVSNAALLAGILAVCLLYGQLRGILGVPGPLALTVAAAGYALLLYGLWCKRHTLLPSSR